MIKKSKDVKISLNWVTRKRPAELVYSVCSFVQNAIHPERLEIMFCIDDDDQDTDIAIRKIYPFLHVSKIKCIILKTKRLGYDHLDKYVRNAGKKFAGDCIILATDDVFCMTNGWDEILANSIKQHLDEPCLIQTQPVEDKYKFWPTMPGITRKWWEITHNIMIYTAGDGYLDEITKELNLRRIRPDYEVHQLSRNAVAKRSKNWTEDDETQKEGRGNRSNICVITGKKRRKHNEDDGIHTKARDVENLTKWKLGKDDYSWPKEDTYQQ